MWCVFKKRRLNSLKLFIDHLFALPISLRIRIFDQNINDINTPILSPNPLHSVQSHSRQVLYTTISTLSAYICVYMCNIRGRNQGVNIGVWGITRGHVRPVRTICDNLALPVCILVSLFAYSVLTRSNFAVLLCRKISVKKGFHKRF